MSHAWTLLLAAPAFQAPPVATPSVVREAREGHIAELTSKTAAALEVSSAIGPPKVTFATHHIGDRYAGPDRDVLGSAAARVHVSTGAVLTPAECLKFRMEAKAALALGSDNVFTYTDLASLGEVHVANLPLSRRRLRRKLTSAVLPSAAACFGLDPSTLRVRDAVVVRYDATTQATRQPMHRDEALLSLNIPLSAQFEYEGGGTRFEGSGALPYLLSSRQPVGLLVPYCRLAPATAHAWSLLL